MWDLSIDHELGFEKYQFLEIRLSLWKIYSLIIDFHGFWQGQTPQSNYMYIQVMQTNKIQLRSQPTDIYLTKHVNILEDSFQYIYNNRNVIW